MLPWLVLHGTNAVLSAGRYAERAGRCGLMPCDMGRKRCLSHVAQQQPSWLSRVLFTSAAWHPRPLQAMVLQCSCLTSTEAAIQFCCLRRLLALGTMQMTHHCCFGVLDSPHMLS